jgi:hypothetical protein
MSDIDIDFADRNSVLKLISHIPASHYVNQKLKTHNSGIYVTDIPMDPVNKHAAIDFKSAEQRGYFKLDFLNMSVYKLVRDHQHYQQLLKQQPPWEKLWQDPNWAKQLVHVGNYISLLNSMRPDSIVRMAAFISVIRPGKSHLQNLPWDQVFAEVWDGDDSRGYTFKKAHSISYSVLVALHMNLLSEQSQ